MTLECTECGEEFPTSGAAQSHLFDQHVDEVSEWLLDEIGFKRMIELAAKNYGQYRSYHLKNEFFDRV